MDKHRAIIASMIVLATAGFFLAFYLTVEHYLGRVPECSFLSGCEEVTTSEYATIAGIPISLFGAGYFLAITILLGLYLERGSRLVLNLCGALVGLGAALAAGLIYIQVGVLGAVCIYCVTSDSISLLLLGLFGAAHRTVK